MLFFVVFVFGADTVHYSWRSAVIGSTDAARSAGMRHARIDAQSSSPATIENASGSMAPTPKSMPLHGAADEVGADRAERDADERRGQCPRAGSAAAPDRVRRRAPCAGRSRACAARPRTTSRRRCRAPRARSATPANAPNSTAWKRSNASGSCTRCSIVLTSAIGRSGSSVCTIAAMLVRIESGSRRRAHARPSRPATDSARRARRSRGNRRAARRCARRDRRRRSATRRLGPSRVTPGINCSMMIRCVQRIEAVQILPHERVVDDRDARGAGRVLLGEGASALHRNAERLEVVGRHHVEAGAGTLRGSLTGRPDDRERHAEARAAHRHAGRHRRGRHARNRARLLEQLAIEPLDLLAAPSGARRGPAART